MKITGFDKLKKTLEQASHAAQELDGDLATLRFDPNDPSSVEAAIAEVKLFVDNRLGGWYGNPIVDRMAADAKASFEGQILTKVEEYKCPIRHLRRQIKTVSRTFSSVSCLPVALRATAERRSISHIVVEPTLLGAARQEVEPWLVRQRDEGSRDQRSTLRAAL